MVTTFAIANAPASWCPSFPINSETDENAIQIQEEERRQTHAHVQQSSHLIPSSAFEGAIVFRSILMSIMIIVLMTGLAMTINMTIQSAKAA